jgi:hypothetical protein
MEIQFAQEIIKGNPNMEKQSQICFKSLIVKETAECACCAGQEEDDQHSEND